MTKKKEAPARPGVPLSLKQAFCSLPSMMRDDRSSWSSGEIKAACLMAKATSGLDECAEEIQSLIGGVEVKHIVKGSLDAVWYQIHEAWDEPVRLGLSEYYWRWLFQFVLMPACATPDDVQVESADASAAFALYREAGNVARALNELLDRVPVELEPGYSREVDRVISGGLLGDLDALAKACGQAADQKETEDGVNPELQDTRTNHTGFFLSVAVNLKKYEFGELPPLKPAHLVAFASVLITGVADQLAREGVDSLRREAARILGNHGPGGDTSR